MSTDLDRSRFLGVASMLIINDGRILLVQEAKEAVKETWNMPAGKIEPGETPAEAAQREAAEEAGMNVTPEALIGVYLDDSDVSDDRVMNFVFLAETEQEDLEADEDIMQAAWIDPRDVEERNLRAPYILEAINDWQDDKKVPLERVNDLTP